MKKVLKTKLFKHDVPAQTRFFGKADVILTSVIVLISLFALIFPRVNSGTDTLYAEVTVNGEPYAKYKLSDYAEKNDTVVIQTQPVTTLILSDASVCFSDAKCTDKTCESYGKLKNRGDSAVCLPAGVSVKITGEKSGNDAVAY